MQIGSSNKSYGLFVPKKKDNKKGLQKANVFGADSSDEDTSMSKPSLKKVAQSTKLKTQTQIEIEKALEEDPNVYQYDEVYDDMQETKKQELAKRTGSKLTEQKPKYIGNLLKAAEIRKKDNERRVERQVQKERELEGDQFKGKDAFVTSSYRAKMQEQQEAEEAEKKKDMIEEMMDVKKQSDMSGFYRHLLNQTTGEEAVPDNTKTDKENATVKVEANIKQEDTAVKEETDEDPAVKEENDEETAVKEEKDDKHFRSEKRGNAKQYRKRNSSGSDSAPDDSQKHTDDRTSKKDARTSERSRQHDTSRKIHTDKHKRSHKRSVSRSPKRSESRSHRRSVSRSPKRSESRSNRRSPSRSPKRSRNSPQRDDSRDKRDGVRPSIKREETDGKHQDHSDSKRQKHSDRGEREEKDKAKKENSKEKQDVKPDIPIKKKKITSEEAKKTRMEQFLKLYAKRNVGDKLEAARARYFLRRDSMSIAIVKAES